MIYESDDDSWQPTFQKELYDLKKLTLEFPKQSIWLHVVEKLLLLRSSEFIFIWSKNTYHEIQIEYTNGNQLKMKMKWIVPTEIMTECFPQVPPRIEWIAPMYPWKDMLPLFFYDPFLPTQWNFCHDMLFSLYELKEYVDGLNTIVSPTLMLTPWYKWSLEAIEYTKYYPNYFTLNRPKMGMVKPSDDKGIGYSIRNISAEVDPTYQVQRLLPLLRQLVEIVSTCTITAQELKDTGMFQLLEEYIRECTFEEFFQKIDTYKIIFEVIDRIECLSEFRINLMMFYQQWKEAFSNDTFNETEDAINVIFSRWKTSQIVDTPHMIPLSITKSEQCWMDSTLSTTAQLPTLSLRRLSVEWKTLQKSPDILPCSLEGGSIYLCWGGINSNHLQTLIIPSKDTPYFGGYFIFDIFIPESYPQIPPKIKFLTTGYNTVRFNPNLYACGKVCLSLLGTWEGEAWNPQRSNITQILLSILTMIFVDDPFYNEPGYERYRNTIKGQRDSTAYNQTIQYNTLKWAISDTICKNSYPIFRECILNHFDTHWKHHIEPVYRQYMEEHDNSSEKQEMECLLKELHDFSVSRKKIISM